MCVCMYYVMHTTSRQGGGGGTSGAEDHPVRFFLGQDGNSKEIVFGLVPSWFSGGGN